MILHRAAQHTLGVAVLVVLVVAACGSDAADRDSPATDKAAKDSQGDAAESGTKRAEQKYPDIVDVSVEQDGDTFTFAVTVSSPYDTPERYADGWRIMGTDGTVYGEHTLMHDHAGEQPFTRTQTGVEIPPEADEVIVEGRDREYGYGGDTKTVTLQ